MTLLNRQQLCAALACSESTVYRLQRQGLPFTPVGKAPRYDLAECQQWLRQNQAPQVHQALPHLQGPALCLPGPTNKAVATSALWLAANAYTASSQLVHRRVMPSTLKLVPEPA